MPFQAPRARNVLDDGDRLTLPDEVGSEEADAAANTGPARIASKYRRGSAGRHGQGLRRPAARGLPAHPAGV